MDKRCELKDPSQLENFEIELVGGRLVARKTGEIPEEAFAYVQKTVDRFNKFKVVGYFNGARSVSFFAPPLPSKAGKRELVYRLRRVYLKERIPAAATLGITYACQLDCFHCSAQLSKDPNKNWLTTEQWKRIIYDTVEMGCTNIIYTGGEPLIRKDIFELVEFVDKDKATVIMFTNGELHTEENLKRLKDAGIYAIFISLDSPYEEEHDRLRRRPGLYKKVMQSVETCKKLDILVGFSSYITHDRYIKGELHDLMELGKNVGVCEIVLFDAVPTGAFLRKTDILLTPEDKEGIMRDTLNYFKKPEYPTLTAQAYVNSPISMGCFAAYNQYYMTAYGEMTPCDFTPISFGNAAVEGTRVVWERMTNHPAYKKRHQMCRMQTPEFRKRYIDRIPDGAILPYPIELLEEQDQTAVGSK